MTDGKKIKKCFIDKSLKIIKTRKILEHSNDHSMSNNSETTETCSYEYTGIHVEM